MTAQTNADFELAYGDLSVEQFCHFRSVERIAWDIETSGLDWRAGFIGTCQLHAPSVATVVVQIAGHRPPHLIAFLEDPDIHKVFHHAPFDLRWMVGHWKAVPLSIECTKLASRLLDHHTDSAVHSLKHLLATYLGIDVDKEQRLSDWLSADLTDDQLTYAVEDVTHLLPLLDVLRKELANNGLIEMYEACAAFLPTRTRLEVAQWPDVFSY